MRSHARVLSRLCALSFCSVIACYDPLDSENQPLQQPVPPFSNPSTNDPPVLPMTGKATGGTCAEPQATHYDDFARDFMQRYCTRCHSSSVTGASRAGAPVGLDLDTLADVRRFAVEIDRSTGIGPAAQNRMMPTDQPAPSDSERVRLSTWLACGAPESAQLTPPLPQPNPNPAPDAGTGALDTTTGADASESSVADAGGAPGDAGPALPCTRGDENLIDPATGHCYMLFRDDEEWAVAQTLCTQMGPNMHLATVTSTVENTMVKQVADSRDVWIGITDLAVEGTFVLVTGQPVLPGYVHWERGQPNNGGNSDCVKLQDDDEGRWDDDECDDSRSYVCERD